MSPAQPFQDRVNELVGAAASLMVLGLMAGMVRSAAKGMVSSPTLARLPQATPEGAPLPQLSQRLYDASEELGAMSLVELVGWTRAERLARSTVRALRQLSYYDASSEAKNLEQSPFSTVEPWLEPGGLAQTYPELRGVAQAVVEAAEARVKARLGVPPEVTADINYRISQRTRYGRREETAGVPGVVLHWSNAHAEWYAGRPIRKGARLSLDANEVFVPYPKRQVEAALHRLDPLPLYKYAYEAIESKRRQAERLGAEGRRESDERWGQGLRALGLEVYAEAGYGGAAPVPRITDVPGLEHIGGGDLSDGERVYRLRINPETGTRFYVAEDLGLATG